MAVRSIIDIDTSAFDRFTQSFQKYQEALGKTQDQWVDVSGQTKNTSVSMEAITAALLAQAEYAHTLSVEQAHRDREERAHERSLAEAAKDRRKQEDAAAKKTSEQAIHWRDIARSTKTVAGNIWEATRSILRWGEITGVVSGLLGVGGLFGIDRLAMSAGNMRRSALGLGTTVGEQRAFSLNFGRLVNPEGFLGGVNESLHDVTKRSSLYAAGLSENQIAGKNTAEVAAELIPALKKIADQTPASMLAQVLQSRHLDQFLTLEDFQRLKATSPAEIADILRQARQDVPSLQLTSPQQKAWQDLQVQLRRAGDQIETTFIRGLTPLTPQIGELSKAVVKLVDDFFSSGTAKEWIDDLAAGIKWLDDKIEDPNFKTSFEEFIKNVGEVAKGLERAAEWIASWFPAKEQYGPQLSPETDPRARRDPNRPTPRGNEDLVTPVWRWTDEMARSFWEALKKLSAKSPEPVISPMAYQPAVSDVQRLFTLASYHPGAGGLPAGPGITRAAYTPFMRAPANSNVAAPTNSPLPAGAPASALFASLEQQYQLPSGLLDSVWATESGRGRNMVSSAGALGHFQFMPATARRFHVDDPYNLNQSATGASQYFNTLLHEFGGDLAKAVASYNWGEGNVERDVRQWGADWQRHLPAETAAYLRRVLGHIASPAAQQARQAPAAIPHIRIENNTGGNVHVTAAAIAAA